MIDKSSLFVSGVRIVLFNLVQETFVGVDENDANEEDGELMCSSSDETSCTCTTFFCSLLRSRKE